MTRKRDHIPLTEKLAACVGQMLNIPFEHLQLMTADQVLSLVQWDHYPIRHVDGGPDEHWNLTPVSICEHREKTAKIDQPAIAKSRRLSKDQEAFRARMLKPSSERKADKPKSKWPKGRKMQSHNNLRRVQT